MKWKFWKPREITPVIKFPLTDYKGDFVGVIVVVSDGTFYGKVEMTDLQNTLDRASKRGKVYSITLLPNIRI